MFLTLSMRGLKLIFSHIRTTRGSKTASFFVPPKTDPWSVVTNHLSSGDSPPALFAEFLGKLIHPFGGWLTQGDTARQYPLAAMSEMFHLSIAVVETGALGRPV